MSTGGHICEDISRLVEIYQKGKWFACVPKPPRLARVSTIYYCKQKLATSVEQEFLVYVDCL